MARPDWSELQKQFLSDHAATGISPKEWCESQELNYATARRHIKKPTTQKGAQSAQTETRPVRNAQKRKVTNYPPFAPGNRAAVKHSGYSKYMPDSDELFEDAAGLDLIQELLFIRARTLSVTKVLGKLRTDFESAEEAEVRSEIARQLVNTEQALDRNIARIESLERTISTLGLDKESLLKIIADTSYRKAATNKINLESDKLGRELAEDDENDTPTPVAININVVDARVREDDSADP
ncbi:Terminase [Morganella morganii]